MPSDPSRVHVEDAHCDHCTVPTKRVHHRDFPEVRAECGSLREGVAHLAGLLARYRTGAQSAWHCASVDIALADVYHFLRDLEDAQAEALAPCQCTPHVHVPATQPTAEPSRSRS